jgi:3,4-dihydroxy 2-butanone 4-phosphate synthase/GTP cyclohydrolase II
MPRNIDHILKWYVILLIEMQISSIEEILADFKKGQFVIMVDHKDRENEGDLMIAAEHVTAEKINFLIKEARGLICLTLNHLQVDQLKIPMMISEAHSTPMNHAAFTYSIEAARGITTGISARERAHTIITAIQPNAKPSDIVSPGHVFPLKAVPGGVLARAGHTEASVDLAALAGLNPSAVLCEILDDEGDAGINEYLQRFSKKFSIKIGAVDDLVAYRKKM